MIPVSAIVSRGRGMGRAAFFAGAAQLAQLPLHRAHPRAHLVQLLRQLARLHSDVASPAGGELEEAGRRVTKAGTSPARFGVAARMGVVAGTGVSAQRSAAAWQRWICEVTQRSAAAWQRWTCEAALRSLATRRVRQRRKRRQRTRSRRVRWWRVRWQRVQWRRLRWRFVRWRRVRRVRQH